MMKQRKIAKRISIITSVMMGVVLLLNLVSAFGVSSPYWKGNPVTISPGETKSFDITLQNMIGLDDATVRAVLVEGEEIVDIDEKDYFIKAGTKDTKVNIRISIPEGTPIDSYYTAKISFNTVTPGGEAVVLGTGIDTSFDIKVTQKVAEVQLAPEETGFSNLTLLSVIILIVIIAVIILVILRKKKESK